MSPTLEDLDVALSSATSQCRWIAPLAAVLQVRPAGAGAQAVSSDPYMGSVAVPTDLWSAWSPAERVSLVQGEALRAIQQHPQRIAAVRAAIEGHAVAGYCSAECPACVLLGSVGGHPADPEKLAGEMRKLPQLAAQASDAELRGLLPAKTYPIGQGYLLAPEGEALPGDLEGALWALLARKKDEPPPPPPSGGAGASPQAAEAQAAADAVEVAAAIGREMRRAEALEEALAAGSEEGEATPGRGSGQGNRITPEQVRSMYGAQIRAAVAPLLRRPERGPGRAPPSRTYRRLHRRDLPDEICPSPGAEPREITIAVVIDTSGSMGSGPTSLRALAISACADVLRVATVRAVACDGRAVDLGVARSSADLLRAPWIGGGGTDLRQGIALAVETSARRGTRPAGVVIITDGDTPWPSDPLAVPMVVIVTPRGRDRAPAWAQTVLLQPPA